jgi:asparagine synthase (glutamine-hydrolysing)
VGHDRARLGARRLAIMDLTTGDQPFQSPDGRIWMVCNGEIYNAPDLRREAAAWGYPFRSTGDIETIVPHYERAGADAVRRLDGMFGLAIWDDANHHLILARDRAGEKPLFWTVVDDELRFASEVQALLVFPDQPRRLDARAAGLYTALGYVPAPHTLITGIAKLPPGSRLEASAQGVTVARYWSAAEAAHGKDRLQSAAQLRDVLIGAVRRELMSDVPIGVFTSGGLDSSFLAAAVARARPGQRIHTYAARFAAPGFDESDFAQAVTRDIHSIHHNVLADDVSLARAFDLVTSRLAEPVGDPAILPTYLLAEAARADVKVVLSGEGADELFGGYPTYLGHRAAGIYAHLPAAIRALLSGAVRRWPTSPGKVTLEFLLKQFVESADRPLLERHAAWFGALGPTPDAVGTFAELLRDFPAAPELDRVLWLDFLTYLPDNLLVKVDRGTMLASIEARAPFLDREVLELVLPSPASRKVRGWETKAILKEAARDLVPAYVIDRRKRGLSVPVASWLNGALRDRADRYFTAPRFGGERVTALWTEHRAGTANHARKLWPVLIAELWADRWNVSL